MRAPSQANAPAARVRTAGRDGRARWRAVGPSALVVANPRSRHPSSRRAGRSASTERGPPGAERPARRTRPLLACELPVVTDERAGARGGAARAGGRKSALAPPEQPPRRAVGFQRAPAARRGTASQANAPAARGRTAGRDGRARWCARWGRPRRRSQIRARAIRAAAAPGGPLLLSAGRPARNCQPGERARCSRAYCRS